MDKYRKRYIEKHGDIPLSWDIHHIDGDRENNRDENLIAIPSELHVVIHQVEAADVKRREWVCGLPNRKWLEDMRRMWEEPFPRYTHSEMLRWIRIGKL